MEPCAVFFCISEAVVESVVTTLPEFDGFRDDAESAPEVWLGDRTLGEALFELFVAGQEVVAGGDFGALVRDPGADAASAGTTVEVGRGFLDGEFFNRANDFDLALEVNPGKEEGGARIGGEVLAFAAGVVGEKYKSAIIQILQQDSPARGLARSIRCGQGHGIGFWDSAFGGLVEPELKLGNRVG